MDERRTPPKVPSVDPDAATVVRQGIRRRTQGEREAYMEGQRSALELVRRKGIEYAERTILMVQATVRH